MWRTLSAVAKEVLMEFTLELGYLGAALLALGSIVIGVLFYVIGDPQFSYEWIVTAIGAFVGALVASEFFIDLKGWDPVYEGVALVPALVGALIGGGVVAGVTRFLTRNPLSTESR
jgi:uncharacterized membrane protein YeaQ/YmgE (transglycosylase-associated protein family)